MVKSKPERVEAYRCNICKKVVVGKSNLRKHVAIPQLVLPIGLVYFEGRATGGHSEGWSPSDPIVIHKDYYVVISSHFRPDKFYYNLTDGEEGKEGLTRLNLSHHSISLAYRLGSGEFASKSHKGSNGKFSPYRYEPDGAIFGINASDFIAHSDSKVIPCVRLTTPREFEKILERLRSAESGFVKKELDFLNQPEGIQGITRTASGYRYHGKVVPTDSSARIDRLILEQKYRLTPKKLIRVTPELEKMIVER